MIIAQECKIDGCNGLGRLRKVKHGYKRYFQKGYCNAHYKKLVKYGDPLHVSLKYIAQREPRKSIVSGDFAMIPIGINAKDGYAKVDKEFAWLDKYKWQLNSHGYACTDIDGKRVRMHRLIFGVTSPNVIIDHKDRDIKNNRIGNLRIATRSQNNSNAKVRSDSSTGVKGVFYKNNRYFVRCSFNGITHGGGKLFTNIEDAIKRYNELSLKYHGEFAYLNEVN